MTVHPFIERVRGAELVLWSGRVRKILPTYIEADGPSLTPGALCMVEGLPGPDGLTPSWAAQVVSVSDDAVRLVPLDAGFRTFPDALVTAAPKGDRVPVGDGFAGRVVDGMGRPIDALGPISATQWALLDGDRIQPMERISPRRPVETGIRAIDALLTLDTGQRAGVFAAAGVGKTSLMTQLANQVQADRIVISLVGERGREVQALWSNGLTAERKAKCALVAATSDQPAAMRVRAALYAASLADHWRSQGLQVLFLLDSVTRLAMALREIGLAAGEPPTVRAYTPGVFAAIPRLVERFGALQSGGATTAIMTVLSETDEVDDPVSEMMRSLLDGHIVLSRGLAEQGHFPAVDIPRSLSRMAQDMRSTTHAAAAEAAVGVLSAYDESRTLIETGIYTAGSNPRIDRALRMRPALMNFLKQGSSERTAFTDAVAKLTLITEDKP